MSLLRELPRYSDNKLAGIEIHALKIKHVIDNPRGFELHFEGERFVPFEVPGEWACKHRVAAGGYFVWDSYGDKSFVPTAVFEASYTLIET